MRIAQATTLHWGGLPNLDYAFGAHTLLAGETGSGKTSLIDAIVAVMAGGDSRKSKFNTAQTQNAPSAKKSKRTIASYIAGSNGMGRFLRANGAHGYVCVGWTQDEGDGSYGTPFTALIGGEATLDRDTEKTATLSGELVRILVRGHIVGHSDLIASGGTVLPGHELIIALRTRYGTAAVRDFRTGGEYLAMLYAFLKGDTTPVSREEADSAIKAFVSAIAYRQPDDIDGLIREEILDAVDNDPLIQRLMETIREVNRLKTEAARMEGNIAQLEAADHDLREAFSAFMQERMARALIEVRRAKDVRDQTTAEIAAREEQVRQFTQTEQLIAEKKKEAEKLENRHTELQARIAKDDVYATKTKLEALIGEQDRDMAAIQARIGSAEAAFISAAQDLTYMESVVRAAPDLAGYQVVLETLRERFSAVSVPALKAAIQAVRDRLGDQPLEIMRQGCIAMRAVLTDDWNTAVNGEAGLRQAFNRSFRVADAAYDTKADEARSILRRVEKLKVGQVEYPEPVEHFLPLLKTQLPQCKPRVLCDVVEITKPEWQSAIEGYLGLDRFTILYDRNYETQVVALAKAFRRDNPGFRGNISVPQLSLAIDDKPRVDDASIVHIISVSSDAEAAGYLKARYGRTLRVDDTATLKSTRSGVMKDGWSTQGYRYQQRRCAEEDLVFGAEIRRKQRAALLRRGEDLKKQLEALASRRQLLGKAAALAGPPAITLTIDDPRVFDEAASLRRMALDDLAGLDLSSVATLIAEVKAIETGLKGLREEIEKQINTRGRLEGVVEALNTEIARLQAHLAELEPKAESAAKQHGDLIVRAFLDQEDWAARFEKELAKPWAVDTYNDRSRENGAAATNSTNDVLLKLDAYKRQALDFQQLQIQPVDCTASFASGVTTRTVGSCS